MPKLKQGFNSTAGLSLQQIEQFWLIFRQNFNNCARQNDFKRFLNVELIGERLFLEVQEMQTEKGASIKTKMSMTIMNAKEQDYYFLIVDRAPYQKLSKHFGTPEDEGNLQVDTYSKENGEPVNLLSRCKAEILAASSQRQRDAYQDSYETYDLSGPVLH